ncbi:MAG: hypothetical protein RIC53_07655 [Cyclobacteriaceae bacterium]
MDYKSIFENKSSKELGELMSESTTLSYEAKVGLKEALDAKGIALTKSMSEEIEAEKQQIESLDYLGNLGFKIVKREDQLVLFRRTTFILVDVFTMIVGVVLTYFITTAWSNGYSIYTDGLSVMPLFVCIFTLLIGGLGLSLLLKALSRLMEYSGFKIIKESSGNTTVIKNQREYRESVLTDSKFDVIDKGAYHALVYSQQEGEETELIRTYGGIRHIKTLSQVKNLLSSK